MTIVFSGDWHLCMRNLDAVKDTVKQLVGILRTSKPPVYFFHLGDILGDRGPANPVDQRVTNYLIESTEEIKDACVDYVFCRGNHDMIAGPDDVPSCVPLLKSLGVTVEDVDWFTVDLTGPTPGCILYVVPYFRDPVRQKRAFQQAHAHLILTRNKRLTNILTFHNEVKGCERNAHSKGEGLTLSDIGAADYDLCVAGHIHRPQFMEPNVHFVGSPFCADWGDANDAKRFLKVEL